MKYDYKVFIFIWTIILLFFLLYYGYSEISDTEQVPVITIKQQKYKILEKTNKIKIDTVKSLRQEVINLTVSDENLKVKTPILLEVQKHKAVTSRIAQWVRQPSICIRLVEACSSRRIHLSGGFFHKEELLFFERVVQVGKQQFVANTNQKHTWGVTIRWHEFQSVKLSSDRRKDLEF